LKANGFAPLKKNDDGTYKNDCYVIIRYKEWRAFYTLAAVRCGSVDMIDRLCFRLNTENPNYKAHQDIKHVPEITDIVDLSQISTGEEWEDQARATLSVDYCHSVVIKPRCRPIIKCVTAQLIDRLKQKETEHVEC